MYGCPDEIFELESSIQIEDGVQRVYLVDKRISERSAEQLSPDEVTLEYLLASGITIDPSRFVNSIGVTEASELEAKKDTLSVNMLEYLTSHEEEIKTFINENNLK